MRTIHCLVAMVPALVFATDGQVLVNQSTLTAAGGTYTITQAGSYKLSGNLTVANIDTTAIIIAHDNVTIDLNGFSIIGPVDCRGGSLCGDTPFPIRNGYGIKADSPVAQSYFNITIENGTIQGMGADGIHLIGDSVTLRDLHVRSNGYSGIVVRSADAAGNPGQANLILHHCTVQLNGGYGIKTYGGAITDNTIDQSGGIGVSIQPS